MIKRLLSKVQRKVRINNEGKLEGCLKKLAQLMLMLMLGALQRGDCTHYHGFQSVAMGAV